MENCLNHERHERTRKREARCGFHGWARISRKAEGEDEDEDEDEDDLVKVRMQNKGSVERNCSCG
jgi:hypothetical protein